MCLHILWPHRFLDFHMQVLKAAGSILLQREIPESVNAEAAKVWSWKSWPFLALRDCEWMSYELTTTCCLSFKKFPYRRESLNEKVQATQDSITQIKKHNHNVLSIATPEAEPPGCPRESLPVQIASETGVTVVMDCGGVEDPISEELLKSVSVLSPNETELARLTGENYNLIWQS